MRCLRRAGCCGVWIAPLLERALADGMGGVGFSGHGLCVCVCVCTWAGSFQVLDGLAHMHKHGFFHRDIKPEKYVGRG